MITTRPTRPATRAQPAARGARGFTLVEIMVALALGMIILLALTVLFSRNTSNHSELERTVRQVESARFSLDALAEDVMHAGYYSEFNPDSLPATPAWQTLVPCATGVAAQGWDTGVTPMQMPVPVQGIAAATAIGCLANRLDGTEALVVRHADTGPEILMAAATSTNLYIQVARCGLDAKRILAAAAPAANPALTFNLRQPDCATVNDRLRRLTQRTYYIATCNDCAAGDGIPTLKRVEMIDGALQTVSIAEGVENLQVEYGLDTDDNGQPNAFVAVGGVNGVAPATNVWENVVSVRLHLLTRSTQATPGFTDTRTYQLGPNVTIATPNDGFKRTLMTSTVRLHNVGGRRE